MTNSDPFQARVRLTKSIPNGHTSIVLGRYELAAIPHAPDGENEAILRFDNEYISKEGKGNSNPMGECELVKRFLGLLINSPIEVIGFRVATVEVPVKHRVVRFPEFTGQIQQSDYSNCMEKLLCLDTSIATQFLRSCNAYMLALNSIHNDASLAFLLLVVAGECLSSQKKVIPAKDLDPDKMKCERFCRFIEEYASEESRGLVTEQDLFRKLLKTAYYSHRSAFAHAGREVSDAARLADNGGRPYLKHYPDGKETFTPGLRWLAAVVRSALLGFLETFPANRALPDEQLLGRMGLERAVLKMKAKRPLAAGQCATENDLEIL